MATSSDPKTALVCEWLLDSVFRDRIREGNKLPSEHVLADMLEVSRLTVRRTFEALRDAGVLTSQQGSGWFLQSLPRFVFNMRVMKDFVSVPQPFVVRSQIVGWEPEPNGVWRLERVHSIGRQPIAFLRAYVLPPIGVRLRELELTDCDIYNALEKKLGVLCGASEVNIDVRPMVQSSERLGIEPYTPVYAMMRTVYDHVGYLLLTEYAFARLEIHVVMHTIPRCV